MRGHRRKKMAESNLPWLEQSVLAVFKNDYCLTEKMSKEFILHMVDIYETRKEWQDMSDATKAFSISDVLDKLVRQGKIESSMTTVKTRYLQDCENIPRTPKRVETFIRSWHKNKTAAV